MPTRTGIDPDPDSDPDFDNDLTDRPPRTRTRRIIVYVNVYRFAVYVYVSELEQEPVRKGLWRSKIGLAIGLAIERTRDGIQHEKPGTATVLLRC